jgi:hypothetical protein
MVIDQVFGISREAMGDSLRETLKQQEIYTAPVNPGKEDQHAIY